MRRVHLLVGLVFVLGAASRTAHAAEICGNGLDDDADGLADEGCYPGLTTGVCESPLSCQETGMVSPLMGGLRYQLPPDVAPSVPFGPGIGLRRFYTSMYAPGGGAPAWKQPLGERWQHTYMTWLARTGTAPTSSIVLHTNRGQDVRATYASAVGGWDTYTLQTGVHVQFLRQRQAAPNDYQLRMLTGETLVYDSTGRLTEIWDTLATPSKVLVAYDGAGQVSTVTDASGKRRLVFGYTGGQLTTVQFQVQVASVFTTYHTTTYGYTTSALTSVTLGGQLAQTNVYTAGYLTQIQDGGGTPIVAFAYNATPGMVARIDAPSGVLGYDYASTRATCTGQTVLYFNLGTTASCNLDADCGSGYLCGGKTGAGTTGRCYRGARCLTVASPSEDVVTTVTALGPPGETCEGACLEASQYIWNTGTGVLDLAAVQGAAGGYTVRAYNANGLPTTISYGDPDTNPANSNGARQTFLSYSTAFPGKLAEVRRQSDLATSHVCTQADASACARTLYTYSTDGKLTQVDDLGYTLSTTNAVTSYAYTTLHSYDTKGRLTQIDGPLAGSDDVTQFTYYSPAGVLRDDFVDEYRRKRDATTFLTQRAVDYDFWGNPTQLIDADATTTCLTFDGARGYLKKRREVMNGASTCDGSAADLVTTWTRDAALRLTSIARPNGSCLFYEYDAKGRLQRTKRRDDCLAASAGDRQDYVYDVEGLVTAIETYNAAGTLTATQPYTYFDSRRLARVVNPVNPATWTGLQYDPRGLLQQVDAAGSLGKTVFNRAGTPGLEGRVTSVDKYKTSSTFDSWNLLYAWLGEQTSVTDGDAKATQTVRDDLGRTIRLVSVDMTAPTIMTYDAASRQVFALDAYGGSSQRTHAFTYDNLGRLRTNDYATNASVDGSCDGATNPPEIERVYDTAPGTCPIGGAGCTRTQGRLAYVRVRLMCASGMAPDNGLDQETFYAYDDAGRVVTEYIRDDAGRVASHSYAWTKAGALTQVTLPSATTLEWAYGSATSNADTDRVTAQSRNGAGNLVTSAVAWQPYGPLAQYNQHSTLGGVATRTRIARNLAYRPTGLYTETQSGGSTLQSTVLTEDLKSRITARDFTPNTLGVTDSYFKYDDQDRLTCETTSLVGTCPTSGTTLKFAHSASPPFTNAGDWKQFHKTSPGTTGLLHTVTLATGTHRIASVCQPDGTPWLGCTNFAYNALGARTSDDNPNMGNDVRVHAYDQRHNKRSTTGWYRNGSGVWKTYGSTSAFDARNRRVYKSYTANETTPITSTWFFYYDALDRLTEVVYTPYTGAPTTYQVFQLLWLGDRLTAYYQTNLPAATVAKRYVVTDETNRPIEMWDWPAAGDTTRVWAINQNAFGYDTIVLNSGMFQPVLFAGQYQDQELTARNNSAVLHRPGLVNNGYRTYDPFVGNYLQVDPLVPRTRSSYGYVDSDPVGASDPSGRAPITVPGESIRVFGTIPTEPTPPRGRRMLGRRLLLSGWQRPRSHSDVAASTPPTRWWGRRTKSAARVQFAMHGGKSQKGNLRYASPCPMGTR